MAIPGLTPTFEVVAKVRIGEKKVSQKGKEYPSSVDHFICDEDEFVRVVGEGAKSLRVFLPFQHPAENFSTGLEWWQGKLLACYSKGELEQGRPVALRKASMEQKGRTINLLEGTEVLSDEPIGQDRRKIVCPVRECPILKRKDCKPMGRLQFFIDGIDRRRGVYQLDTKSWNSIENIEATLSLYPDLRGVPFVLRVEFTQKGRDRFPELYLESEDDVEIKTEADVTLADALVQLRKAYDGATEVGPGGTAINVDVRTPLAAVLDLTHPGWLLEGTDGEIPTRIREVGVIEAARKMLDRYGV